MRPFDPHRRLVDLEVDRGVQAQRRWGYGTGCIVAGRTVLTSAHVVAGAVKITVRFVDKTQRPAKPLEPDFVGDPDEWRADRGGGPDLALFTIDDDTIDLPRLPLARIDRSQQGPLRDVRAVGFPWFTERTQSQAIRVVADVYGDVGWDSGVSTGLPVLNVTHSPATRDDGSGGNAWSGMSGAPLLVVNRLIGVVCEHAPRQGAGSITFVPLTALHPDPVWGTGWRIRSGGGRG